MWTFGISSARLPMFKLTKWCRRETNFSEFRWLHFRLIGIDAPAWGRCEKKSLSMWRDSMQEKLQVNETWSKSCRVHRGNSISLSVSLDLRRAINRCESNARASMELQRQTVALASECLMNPPFGCLPLLDCPNYRSAVNMGRTVSRNRKQRTRVSWHSCDVFHTGILTGNFVEW